MEQRRFTQEAETILSLCRVGHIEAYAATMSFATMSYLLRQKSKEQIHDIFSRLSSVVEVASVTTEQFANAMQFGPVRDFEDLLQYQCAVAAGCDVIVTNNIRDYREFCEIPIMSSRDFLLQYFLNH